MAVVVGNKVVVNGMVVGTVEDCKYEVPSVIDVEYHKNTVYVIS